MKVTAAFLGLVLHGFALGSAAAFVKTINVRLHKGYTLSDLSRLPIPESVSQVRKMIQFPMGDLERRAARGTNSASATKALAKMNLWHTVVLDDGADAQAIAQGLQDNSIVDVIEVIDKPGSRPSWPRGRKPVSHRALQTDTPDFESDQGYLNPAPEGIDAEFAWTQTGGTGKGVKIYDAEWSWNLDHEDLLLDIPILSSGKTRCKSRGKPRLLEF